MLAAMAVSTPDPEVFRLGFSGEIENGRHFCPPFHRINHGERWGAPLHCPVYAALWSV
jgi:hypothetical protein